MVNNNIGNVTSPVASAHEFFASQRFDQLEDGVPYSWTVVSTKKAPSRDMGGILMLNTLLSTWITTQKR